MTFKGIQFVFTPFRPSPSLHIPSTTFSLRTPSRRGRIGGGFKSQDSRTLKTQNKNITRVTRWDSCSQNFRSLSDSFEKEKPLVPFGLPQYTTRRWRKLYSIVNHTEIDDHSLLESRSTEFVISLNSRVSQVQSNWGSKQLTSRGIIEALTSRESTQIGQ